jgi:hypothetical protein
MAERNWGGRRTPRNPAPVSGPGQLSQRTDGGPQQTAATMTGMPYGENAEFNTMQSQAPLSASGQAAARGSRQAKAQPMPTPLFSPTQRPDEPITAGAPFGPGEGPPNLPVYNESANLSDTLLKLLPYDSDGSIGYLLEVARRRGW